MQMVPVGPQQQCLIPGTSGASVWSLYWSLMRVARWRITFRALLSGLFGGDQTVLRCSLGGRCTFAEGGAPTEALRFFFFST